MKNKQEEEKKLNNFTPEIYERLNMLEGKLKEMKTQKKVSEETIRELDNLISELLILRISFVENVINWTKQGYLVQE